MHSKLPLRGPWIGPGTGGRDHYRLYSLPVADVLPVAATQPGDDVEFFIVARVRIAA
jgi:hypothetical protein